MRFPIYQYRIDEVNRSRSDCSVRLTLCYCRRNHYHHWKVCGFDAKSSDARESRNRSDSLPLADLDALFQSTTTSSARPVPAPTDTRRTLESLPSAGNVTLLVRFSPTYPAPDCPPTFTFVASDPVVQEFVLMRMLKVCPKHVILFSLDYAVVLCIGYLYFKIIRT